MKNKHLYRIHVWTLIVCVSFTVGCSYVSGLRTKILGPTEEGDLSELEGGGLEEREDTREAQYPDGGDDTTKVEDSSVVDEVADTVNQEVEVSNARRHSGRTEKDNPTTLSGSTSADGERRLDDGQKIPVVDSKPFIRPGSIIPKTYISPQTSSKEGVSASTDIDKGP